MKLVLDQPCMNPFDPTTDLRVLIACEDSAAAGQACAVLECLGRNCEPDGRLIYQWWNFEVLAITLLRRWPAARRRRRIWSSYRRPRTREAAPGGQRLDNAVAEPPQRPARGAGGPAGSRLERFGRPDTTYFAVEKIGSLGADGFFREPESRRGRDRG